MILFILSVLSFLVGAFLVMVAVQLIRIERILNDCTNLTEMHVKKLYGKF
jgi:hypothetical protein